jgi:hypothetical protein
MKAFPTALTCGLLLTTGYASIARADTIVPIVGHLQGANNTVFRSDLKLYNTVSSPISGTIQLTERGQAETATDPSIPYTIPADQVLLIEDVYARATPGRDGAARLRTITAVGSLEPIADSSTYTLQPQRRRTRVHAYDHRPCEVARHRHTLLRSHREGDRADEQLGYRG